MTNTSKLAIFGVSGHGREVLDIGYDLGIQHFKFLELDTIQGSYQGFDIVKDTPQQAAKLAEAGWHFAIGVGAPRVREKIATSNPALIFPNLIHSSVTMGYKLRESLAPQTGVVMAAGCSLTNSIVIGRHVQINRNCTIGHDSILDDFASLMPGVNVSGNVHVSRGVYIGAGATIIHGANDKRLKIGGGATIGAGAVVTRDIAAGVTAVGVPAKPLQK